ncbi:PREDICTED: inositol 3-kinase-like [Camelina sativa]|uniref:Inositol 3-kinase-like n=1 Tax=Camelina sativa TaxID=90675 RepID=A0ABM0XBG6_CAMSA|nr:PREDICTED: inositol 3-kinase-like [Camelina sativa]
MTLNPPPPSQQTTPHSPPNRRVLIVGNYCHDVLIQNGSVVAETLGGAASFISNVLDSSSVSCELVSKVGRDFRYEVTHSPIVVLEKGTTVFEAYFDLGIDVIGHADRVLKRVSACDPILPSDIPDSRFDFGMAVGVGGEILPETLEKMVEICDVVAVDIQALIRVFDPVDGSVKLVDLRESGFFHILHRIGYLKASSDEALFMDVEQMKHMCCVVVTNGEKGCRIYHKDDETMVPPFVAKQVDPTGAGDSYLGGLVVGLVEGLAVPDAALLGNFFGSITVEHIGQPKFDLMMLQRVKEEVQRRKKQRNLSISHKNDQEEFHARLTPARFSCVDSPVQTELLVNGLSCDR